jgi:hypothetical protein
VIGGHLKDHESLILKSLLANSSSTQVSTLTKMLGEPNVNPTLATFKDSLVSFFDEPARSDVMGKLFNYFSDQAVYMENKIQETKDQVAASNPQWPGAFCALVELDLKPEMWPFGDGLRHTHTWSERNRG